MQNAIGPSAVVQQSRHPAIGMTDNRAGTHLLPGNCVGAAAAAVTGGAAPLLAPQHFTSFVILTTNNTIGLHPL